MIETIFEQLKAAGMVNSGNKFSSEWLGMEESYMRGIKAKDRKPSPRALINCAVKLKLTSDALGNSRMPGVRAKGEGLKLLARGCVEEAVGDDLRDWLR